MFAFSPKFFLIYFTSSLPAQPGDSGDLGFSDPGLSSLSGGVEAVSLTDPHGWGPFTPLHGHLDGLLACFCPAPNPGPQNRAGETCFPLAHLGSCAHTGRGGCPGGGAGEAVLTAGAPQGPRPVVHPPQTRPLSRRAQMARPGNMGTVAPAPTSELPTWQEMGHRGRTGSPPDSQRPPGLVLKGGLQRGADPPAALLATPGAGDECGP